MLAVVMPARVPSSSVCPSGSNDRAAARAVVLRDIRRVLLGSGYERSLVLLGRRDEAKFLPLSMCDLAHEDDYYLLLGSNCPLFFFVLFFSIALGRVAMIGQ